MANKLTAIAALIVMLCATTSALASPYNLAPTVRLQVGVHIQNLRPSTRTRIRVPVSSELVAKKIQKRQHHDNATSSNNAFIAPGDNTAEAAMLLPIVQSAREAETPTPTPPPNHNDDCMSCD